MDGKRQKNQRQLAFMDEPKGEAPRVAQQGTEPSAAKWEPESPAREESYLRTLNSSEPPWYGPVCPVVWEGGAVRPPPIPIISGTVHLSARWSAPERRRESRRPPWGSSLGQK